MRLTGFRSFDWESAYYAVGITPGVNLFNSVTPSVLFRPGTTPTFGIPQIGPMVISGQVVLQPGHPYGSAEAAFLNFFKRINPLDFTPGELRGVRIDGAVLKIPAVIEIPQYGDSDVLVKNIIFHCASSLWTATGYTTGSGGFS